MKRVSFEKIRVLMSRLTYNTDAIIYTYILLLIVVYQKMWICVTLIVVEDHDF
jgi:hypothetical protein